MKYLEDEDQFIKGALSGIIAGSIMFVFVEIFHWLGITKFGVSYLAGDTVFTYKNNLEMNLIAFMIHYSSKNIRNNPNDLKRLRECLRV